MGTPTFSIAQCFRQKGILITGVTGFLGKPLLAKILKDLPEVKRIYLLIRPKELANGELLSAQERFEKEILASDVFASLREEYGPAFDHFVRSKVVAINGDITHPELGMSLEQYSTLVREVDIIINSAAVVKFDAPLDEAVQQNTLAPQNLVRFANACGHAVYLHVSTAYVNSHRSGKIVETLYPPSTLQRDGEESAPLASFDLKGEIQDILDRCRRIELASQRMEKHFRRQAQRQHPQRQEARLKAQVEALRKRWVRQQLVEEGMRWAKSRGWNDTYTFTKALGEHLIAATRGDLPVVILRPSIIESSLLEPYPGWLDGFRMADPIIIAFGKGRLKNFPLNPEATLDLIPVDFVVNAILAAIARASQTGGLSIYHVATGAQNPLTNRTIFDYSYEYFSQHPMLDKQGNPIRVARWSFPGPRRFYWTHYGKTRLLLLLSTISEHGLPFRWAAPWRYRLATLSAAAERLLYYAKIYGPYITQNCCFDTTQTQELLESLGPEDRQRFNFDVLQIDWKRYIQEVHIPGVKRHILKLDSSPLASLEEVEIEPSEEQQALPPPPATINELFERTAAAVPHKIAFQIKRNGQWVRYSYREAQNLIRRMIAQFLHRGYRRGDRVLLYAENQPEWGIAYLAAMSMGLTVLPIDWQTPEAEVWNLARFAQARAILTSAFCHTRFSAEALQRNREAEFSLDLLNINQECTPFEERPPQEERGEITPPTPESIASIIFTAGTSVDPQGVMLSHKNFLANVQAISAVFHPQPTDHFLSVLPLHHALEFTCGFLIPLSVGATITYAHTLRSRHLFKTMQETRPTVILGMPRFYRLLYDCLQRHLDWNQLSEASVARARKLFGGKIRFLISGGAALDPELYEAFQQIHLPIYEGYGLTEAGPVVTVNPPGRSKKGSVGLPLPGVELRIDKPDARGRGEIVVCSPGIMSGYFHNPKATARVLKDGWLYTGDLGYQDAEGYLYITGRQKEVIVSEAGKNIYPEELEAIYKQVPGVAEICVLGLRPPGASGEEVHAVIVPTPAFRQRYPKTFQRRIQQGIKRVAGPLPTYKHLQKVHFWEGELPKTATLTPHRRQIKELLLRQHRPEKRCLPGATTPWTPQTKAETRLVQELSRLSGYPAAQIHPSHHLELDLGIDSLMKMELLLLLETLSPQKGAATALPVEQLLQKVHTVQDLLALLHPSPDPKPRSRSPEKQAFDAFQYLTTRNSLFYQCATRLFHFLLRHTYQHYFRLQCRGLEHLPSTRPYIIAANHTSHLDSGAIITALGKEARHLYILGARDYFFNHPWKGWFFNTFLHVLPFDRHENFLQGVRVSKEALSQGHSLLIYPEGTRSITGALQPFKRGLGFLACEARVPIVPAYIHGSYEALPKGAVFPKRRKITVTFGPPVSIDAFCARRGKMPNHLLYQEVIENVRRRIEELRDHHLRAE